MAIEIERKFLVAGDAWRGEARRSRRIVQGYLSGAGGQGVACSVRVRTSGDSAWVTIKSAVPGVERREYEYPVPLADARAMLAEFCAQFIEKTRHDIVHEGLTFEVDEFGGANAGLVIAEVELDDVDRQFARPSWLGQEVSDKPRYYNAHLLQYPFSAWSAGERAGD